MLRPYVFGPGATKNYARYLAAKSLIEEAGSITACELTVRHVAGAHATISACNLAPRTRYLAVMYLRRQLLHLTPHGAPFGLADSAPKLSRPAPRPNTVTDAQLSALLAASSPRMQLFLLLCHDCALRSGTAVQVARRHLSEDGRLVTIRTKRANVARIPISARLAALIKQCPPGDAPLVSLLSGHSCKYSALNFEFRNLVETLGLPGTIRFHDLRRTMAEKTYALTSDLRVVQTLLAHDSLTSTLSYLQRPAQTHMDALAASIETITASHERFPE